VKNLIPASPLILHSKVGKNQDIFLVEIIEV